MTRDWSVQQQAIFGWFAQAIGNLVVRARAGTGKTTTILEAIRHITGDAKILLCAFNKRIQTELAQKLNDVRAEAKTLHALGFAFLRRQWKVGDVTDDVEWDRINEVDPNLPPQIAGFVKKLVSVAKGAAPFGTENDLIDLALEYDCAPDNGWEEDGWTVEKIASMALEVMESSKTRRPDGNISFDDMLYLPLVLGFARPWYDWVIVDEAQDMNTSQLLLAQRACKPNGHIVVVGDDKQAIYGFRGADSGSIDRLKQELKATELGLTITYRCPKRVVAEAQALVPDYQAADTAPEGKIESLSDDRLHEVVRVEDAILSRTNAPLVTICLGLIRRGVPSRIEGRDIGKALLAIVQKMKAKSVPDFLKRLRGWGDKQKSRILAKAKNPDRVESKLQNVDDQVETLVALAEGCASVGEIEKRCIDFFADTVDPRTGQVNRKPAVVCSSVHKAKGLEWSTVYILAWTLYCNGARKDDPEEKNIHYVAVTRSKDTLVYVQKASAAPAKAEKVEVPA